MFQRTIQWNGILQRPSPGIKPIVWCWLWIGWWEDNSIPSGASIFKNPSSHWAIRLAINLDGAAGVKSKVQIEDILPLLQNIDGSSPFAVEKAWHQLRIRPSNDMLCEIDSSVALQRNRNNERLFSLVDIVQHLSSLQRRRQLNSTSKNNFAWNSFKQPFGALITDSWWKAARVCWLGKDFNISLFLAKSLPESACLACNWRKRWKPPVKPKPQSMPVTHRLQNQWISMWVWKQGTPKRQNPTVPAVHGVSHGSLDSWLTSCRISGWPAILKWPETVLHAFWIYYTSINRFSIRYEILSDVNSNDQSQAILNPSTSRISAMPPCLILHPATIIQRTINGWRHWRRTSAIGRLEPWTSFSWYYIALNLLYKFVLALLYI